MPNGYPYPESQAKRSIVAGILLSLVTFGIYGLYWQYKQMATLNAWLERNEYSFWLWFFLSIITCGIFGIYYEYKMATGINEVQADNDAGIRLESTGHLCPVSDFRYRYRLACYSAVPDQQTLRAKFQWLTIRLSRAFF